MKKAKDILTYGVIKKYGFRKKYEFNSIDIETVNNEMFLLGYHLNDVYYYKLDNFFTTINNILIKSVQENRDILTWSRYDNHHIFKVILNNVITNEDEKIEILKKIGKITPLLDYNYKGYTITVLNIIKDSIIIEVRFGNSRKRVNIYNLKNLFQSDLLTIAQNYNLTYYSKLGEEFHIIDKERFFNDEEYMKMVIKSNELDSKVIIDIANKFIESFVELTGSIPKTIYTAGSIARSFLLTSPEIDPYKLNFYHYYKENPYFEKLLDYAMKSYHGGKIDSYVIGYVGDAYVADITSAYPSAIAELPELTQNVIYRTGPGELEKYYYAFVRCNVFIPKSEFIHPLIVQSPISPTNISPQGYLQNIVITKPEYEYLQKYKNKYNLKIEVIDYIAIEHNNNLIFKNLVYDLFNKRLAYKKEGNNVLADLTKTIINSLYGITYELTPIYEINDEDIQKAGLRAGDFFNPIFASYITAKTRCLLSDASMNIIENDGTIYLHMTDSIIFYGTLDKEYYKEEKTLGFFEKPEKINDVIILGAGRYEYRKNGKYIIKNRGFHINDRTDSFYSKFDINRDFEITIQDFVTFFKASLKKYNTSELGHIKEKEYNIDPFNLGGKRLINEDEKKKTDLRKSYIKTYPIYIDEYLTI
ncbi:MAG: DNA polymerase [Thermoplasmata archaeon]